ncbi:MAG: FecR domain-containing protein [Planctomycetota bacterium]|nr:FecR domain-containing protein [Planctomycetota bacterium]
MSKDQHPFGHGIPQGASDPSDRLESVLRAQPVEPARKDFRTALKAQFLAGEAVESESEGPAGELHESFGEVLSCEKAPAPDPDFRNRMRGQFLGSKDNALEQSQEDGAAPVSESGPRRDARSQTTASSAASQSEPVRQVRSRGSAPKKPGTLLQFWAPMAAAAALLLFFLGPKFLGGGQKKVPFEPNLVAWSLPDDLTGLEWTIDGESVDPASSPEEIGERLSQAKSVAAVDGGGLRLAYGRYFQVAVAEGSALDLSGLSQVASNTDFQLGMVGESGGFYIQTGPDFKSKNCELTFQTPDAEVGVLGTVFAIDRYTAEQGGEGTCVCCSEGNVKVVDAFEGQFEAGAGKSCFVMPGSKKMMGMDVVHDHQVPMDELIRASAPAGW